MKLTIVAGARPNFMKIAPIIHALKAHPEARKRFDYRLVHTGQHYDHQMSQTFFEELNIPAPDRNLGVGSGTQAEQTARIMVTFEKELIEFPSDLVIVVGDVTSTMACAIVAKKTGVRVAHVEAGIRSWDLGMPEEINRMVTDCLTDYFFTTSETANQNLLAQGVRKDKIFFVGNVMIDTLLTNLPRLRKPAIYDTLSLAAGEYFVMTMHRPSNVDEAQKLKVFIREITENAGGLPVVFPMHPRTAKVFQAHGIEAPNLHTVDPLGYLEFVYLVKHAKGVLTDSGGVTEETTILGIPCITLRDSTERPETVVIGTNELVGTDPRKIKPALEKILAGHWKRGNIPELWDGKSAQRIVDQLVKQLDELQLAQVERSTI